MQEEEILYRNERCHVFRVPPTNYLVSSAWEGNHIWTGQVQVVRRWSNRDGGAGVPLHFIELIDSATRELFGQCPLRDERSGESTGVQFQIASDSSRCFVIRLEQGDQFAYLGLNFEQKSDAIQFCTAVVERCKRLHLLRSADLAPQEGITRYLGDQTTELRAVGKIAIELHGKIAVPQPAVAIGQHPKSTAFSLSSLPQPTPTSRRIVVSAASSSPSTQSSGPSGASAEGSIAVTASQSSSQLQPAGQRPKPQSVVLPDPFEGLDAQTAAPSVTKINASPPPSTTTMTTSLQADPFAGLITDMNTTSLAATQPPPPPPPHINVTQRGGTTQSLDDIFR